MCACGTAKTRIGEAVSEKLDYVPASVRVLATVRPKYACPRCHDGVTEAVAPPQAVERSLATEGLLAYVVVSKASPLPAVSGAGAEQAATERARVLTAATRRSLGERVRCVIEKEADAVEFDMGRASGSTGSDSLIRAIKRCERGGSTPVGRTAHPVALSFRAGQRPVWPRAPLQRSPVRCR